MVWHHSPLGASHARHIIMRGARSGRSPLAGAFDPPGQRLKLIASGEDWVMFRKVALFSIAMLTGVGAGVGAPGVGVAPRVGTPNGGGPVNRPGLR